MLQVMILFGLASLGSATFAQSPSLLERLSSRAILDEVSLITKRPHIFDLTQHIVEVRSGYYSALEKNNFYSYGAQLGALIFTGWGGIEVGSRYLRLEETASSIKMAKTPFRQDTQPSRFEPYILGEYFVFTGRGFGPLSTYIGDVEQTFGVLGGFHYWYQDKKQPVPTAADITQQPLGIEAEFRWRIYSKWGIGLQSSFNYQYIFGSGISSVYGLFMGMSIAL